MSDFYIKKSDRLPVLRAELSEATGVVNLSGASVNFVYRNRSRSTAPVTGTATIFSAVSGIVEYAWTSADTTTPGQYMAEWRATLTGGKQLTFPNSSYLIFEIINTIG